MQTVGLYQESPTWVPLFYVLDLGRLLTGLEPAHTQHFSSTTPQGASLPRALPTELQELVQRAGFEPAKRNGM